MSIQEIFGAGFAGMTEEKQVRKAATELEAIVVAQLLGAMRKTVPEGSLFEKSASNEIFRSLLDVELARETAQKSPFGLADAIVKEFRTVREAAGEPPPAELSTEPTNPEATIPVKSYPTDTEGPTKGPDPSAFRRIG